MHIFDISLCTHVFVCKLTYTANLCVYACHWPIMWALESSALVSQWADRRGSSLAYDKGSRSEVAVRIWPWFVTAVCVAVKRRTQTTVQTLASYLSTLFTLMVLAAIAVGSYKYFGISLNGATIYSKISKSCTTPCTTLGYIPCWLICCMILH